MPFQSGVRVAVTGQPNFWNFDYESYPQGTPVETFDPFSEATLAGASAAAELWNKAGTDPGILPAGAVHEGTVSLPPGSSVLLFARSGSGTLRAIGISGIEPHGDADLRGVSLEATWDGHAEPDIAAPLADLFLSGVGERGAARGLLAGYLPGSHEGYLFFPMPFTTGASVRLRNQGANAVTAGWRVEESPALYDSIGERAGELRATFRAEATTATGKDYRLFEGNGAGAVVGLSYTEEGPHSPSLTVFMEGDERVYIDGSKTPQIYGTGTEDIFNGGFYYSTGPFTRPTHGATAKEAAPMGAVVSQYRLLLADPWGFRRSIRVGIEHGGGDGIVTSTRSVVFWYALAGPGTAASDAIDVGEVASEAAHEYQSESPGTFTLTAFYEGEEDGNISSPVLDATILPGSLPAPAGDPMGESVTDDGRYHPPGSTIEFQVQVDSENAGVILRRRLDQLTFSQRALVLVDGVSAGVWSTPTVNDAKRWADSDFALPASLCQGKGALSITLVVLGPIRPPLVAGGLPDEATAPNLPSLNLPLDQGWSDFRYEVFSLR
jgi:hypothetical protein